MFLQKFRTLQDYAHSSASAICNPDKEYFNPLCEYIYLSTSERIIERFLESENLRLEETFKNEVVRMAIRENGTEKEDGEITLQTPGLQINGVDVQCLNISTYGSLAYFTIEDKKIFIHIDISEIIIPYLKSVGILPDDISQVNIPESLLFDTHR